MDKRLLSLYISRILSGQYIFVYNDTIYKLIYPSINIKYQAELCALDIYENNKYNDWISNDDIINWLIDSGLWSYEAEHRLDQMDHQIEDHKVDLFNNFLNPTKLKSIRRSLDNLRRTQQKLYSIRHSFDHITIEGYSNLIKNQFIFMHSIYDAQDKLLFPDLNKVNYNLLNTLLNVVNDNTIDIPVFKTIARNEVWRNYWSANKENIFGKPTIEWTDEQKTLVVLTKMYDSVNEHPECPPDSVIEDDDMLDGWMILQKRENEKQKSKNRSEKLLKDKKLGNAKEVFLVANSVEEANNIYNLNDSNSRNIIKERNQLLAKANRDIKEAELPDVQRDILVQNNQQFIQSRKR